MTPLDFDVEQLIQQIVEEIRQHPVASKAPKIIGIRTGGLWIAERIHQLLDLDEPVGAVNTAFYRDDFETSGLRANIQASDISWNVDGANIILVDDVLFTGRTIRGAINEIFDFGRPSSITLVTLVDRQGYRQLPFCADITGLTLQTDYPVKLTGPSPLVLCKQDNELEAQP